MRFYLGTHRPHWLRLADVPLFVSRRWMPKRYLPQALAPWALDSGGFTELGRYGRWTISPSTYVNEVKRFREEIGQLEWCAPMDWMCEPQILAETGLSIAEHQRRTVDSFLYLRGELGSTVIPVVQGWALGDYLRCVELYDAEGIDLRDEPLVGVGTICRRQATTASGRIIGRLSSEGLRCHGFGVKITGLALYANALVSADSMAWSARSRHSANDGEPTSCGKTTCANCLHAALEWRESVVSRLNAPRRPSRLDQLDLWEDLCVV